MIALSQVLRWRNQTLAESIGWHSMTKSITEENVNAFRAGYEDGYRAALSALACHGYLDVDPTK